MQSACSGDTWPRTIVGFPQTLAQKPASCFGKEMHFPGIEAFNMRYLLMRGFLWDGNQRSNMCGLHSHIRSSRLPRCNAFCCFWNAINAHLFYFMNVLREWFTLLVACRVLFYMAIVVVWSAHSDGILCESIQAVLNSLFYHSAHASLNFVLVDWLDQTMRIPKLMQNAECRLHWWQGMTVLKTNQPRISHKTGNFFCAKNWARCSSFDSPQRVIQSESDCNFVRVHCGPQKFWLGFRVRSVPVESSHSLSQSDLHSGNYAGQLWVFVSLLFWHTTK